jgi:UDP:flavonoid glycosyltransferase YjiC (YdhE family)
VPGVLFSWELGRGAGHLANIRRMAARLKARGFRITAAVPEPAAARMLADVCDEVIRAPAWPDRGNGPAAQSSATFGDILSARGMADRDTVHALLVAWQEIFSQVEPDLLVADLAPASALAARARIPVLLVGNGYTLPSADLAAFPPFDAVAVPQWDERRTLDAVNGALQSVGQSALDYLPQIFAADARSIQTFALLDPYDLMRNEPLDGPLFDEMPQPRSPDANGIFVYLSGGYDIPQDLLAALRPFGERVRMYAPNLPDPARQDLTAAGVAIDSSPVPLADALSSSRLVIHTGGGGVAAEALAAGAPQLILSSHIEQDLNGEALQRAGSARLIRTYRPVAEMSSDLIATMLADVALSRRADELGTLHRQILQSADPALRFEQKCLMLLRR